jgi:hypothetical protein
MKITEEYIKQLIKEAVDPLDPFGQKKESPEADVRRAAELASGRSTEEFAGDKEREEELQQHQKQADRINMRVSRALEKMKLRHFQIPDKYKADPEKFGKPSRGTGLGSEERQAALRQTARDYSTGNNLLKAYEALDRAVRFMEKAWRSSKQ